MTFDPGQYKTTTDKVSSGADLIEAKISQLMSAASRTVDHWYIPEFLKDAIKSLVSEIITGAEKVWHETLELLKGVAVPVYLFEYAWRWEDNLGTATDVSASTTVGNVGITSEWTGAAATAYASAITPQSSAAAEIATISGSVATSLAACALAGSAFYVALGAIAFQVVMTLVGAIAALGTDVFCLVGLELVLGDIKLTPAMIWAAVAAVSALVSAEGSQMVSLHGLAETDTYFPAGRWPQATIPV
jgi:hypothetical protein